jgi:GST-like protein
VKRGRLVNRFPASQLHERHDASHFDTKTQDKLAARVEQDFVAALKSSVRRR